MSIYYQDEHVTLYHGDCLTEHTEWLEADVLVTDPPYGMSYTGFGGRKGEPRRSREGHKIENDGDAVFRDLIVDSWADRPALVFGKWTIPRPVNTRQRIIWDKRPCGFIGDLTHPYGSAEEEIYLLGQGWKGISRTANIISAKTYMSGDAERPNHPTPKPVNLMEQLIDRCPPGIITDPCAGSGPTLIAARNLGRQAIGVELDERYCEIIASRLSQGVFDLAAIV